jgi:hypothetical protein
MEREAYPHMPDMASNPKKDMYFAANSYSRASVTVLMQFWGTTTAFYIMLILVHFESILNMLHGNLIE